MDCNICNEPFDHSIRKPFVLSSCGHSNCFSCLKQLKGNKCSQCRATFKNKYPNISLLNLIPESNYDKLKTNTLKQFGQSYRDFKSSRDQKLKIHEDKLKSIKKVISDETTKLIGVLKDNQKKLNSKCDSMLYDIKHHFDKQFILMEHFNDETIQNNELNEEELNSYNNKIPELKQQLDQLSDRVKKYQFNYEFDLNEISNKILLIGELNTVNIYIFLYYI